MRRYIKMSVLMLVAVTTSIFVKGCETQAQSGALIGSGIGAGVGAIAGRSTESTLIGAAVGGGAGYIIGNEADKKQQQQQMKSEMSAVSVNIHNSNGSVSTVRVTRSGTGYVGPRGEFYDHLPTEAELRPVYGF